MIMKIYQLYQDAAQAEEAERRSKELYKKPAGGGNR